LLHEEILGGPGGLVFGLESFERFVEVFLIFAGEDSGFGGETVAQGVKAQQCDFGVYSAMGFL
jgi:hypothetical protein